MSKVIIELDMDDPRFAAVWAALPSGTVATIAPKAAEPAPAAASAGPAASPAPAPAPTAAPAPPGSAATPSPAPVTMPMAQPAPTPAAAPQAVGGDMSQVTAALSGYIGRHSASAAKAILQQLGVNKATELQPHQFAQAIAAFSA